MEEKHWDNVGTLQVWIFPKKGRYWYLSRYTQPGAWLPMGTQLCLLLHKHSRWRDRGCGVNLHTVQLAFRKNLGWALGAKWAPWEIQEISPVERHEHVCAHKSFRGGRVIRRFRQDGFLTSQAEVFLTPTLTLVLPLSYSACKCQLLFITEPRSVTLCQGWPWTEGRGARVTFYCRPSCLPICLSGWREGQELRNVRTIQSQLWKGNPDLFFTVAILSKTEELTCGLFGVLNFRNGQKQKGSIPLNTAGPTATREEMSNCEVT